ncbi:hypothetical protein [Kribbella sp. NPDC055071]
MNEEDLNEALHDVMVRSSPPPSMDPARALDQARRARKRRTVTLSVAAVVPLMVGVAAASAVVANYSGDRSSGPMVAGSTGTTRPGSTAPPKATTPTAAPTTRKSGDPWPEGQVDRTATTGPRVDRAVTLLHDLTASLPAGFTAPNLKFPDGRPMNWPEAQYASADGEPDYWAYLASIPVQKDNGVGQLRVQSTTPDRKKATTPCKLALRFGNGTCTVVNAGGQKVGVVTAKERVGYDQWAAYRYDDGTVVYLAQVKKSDSSGRPALTQPVFTTQQLAEAVLSPKFKISS